MAAEGNGNGRLLGRGESWGQIFMLILIAGGMLASATYFIVSHNDNGIASNEAAINSLYRTFMEAHAAMGERVTKAEAAESTDRAAIDRLNVLLDQERAALNDLTTAVTKLQGALEDGRHR